MRNLLVIVIAICFTTACTSPSTQAPATTAPSPTEAQAYVPQAQYCAVPGQPMTLCSTIPGNIGPDPALEQKIAYNGIEGSKPTSAQNDVQTPFDNLSWQTFVALNWAKGRESQPPQQGLQGDGPRVWETWPKVSEIFGNGPKRANCNVPAGTRLFEIASDGRGRPVGQNEEYIQAATGDPAIDVSGNWTIYERRLNDIEVAYLRAPQGNANWNLTNLNGQSAFVKVPGNKVDFPAVGDQNNKTGAIEIKAAWRVLDPAKRVENQKKFYLVSAMLTVAPDLVTQQSPICAQVDMGLVAMHIIQKNPLNPVTQKNLKPEWFWTTFEHVDNAPLAAQPCDPAAPAKCPNLNQLTCAAQPTQAAYSYFNRSCPDCATNQPPIQSAQNPKFAWNQKQPFALSYLTKAQSGGGTVVVGTQISRCWNIYSLTDQLNTQWRKQLASVGSVFQNYMLIGTQWGADLTNTPDPSIPPGVVPSFLSNSVVETYLQKSVNPKDPFSNGSCVTCHRAATLLVTDPSGKTPPSNLSFLPQLAQKGGLVRREPLQAAP